ncbi:TPA: PfkB family carbohydrate kinase [Klebsiella oxytoca]|nr:DeoR family transcriptional regulator [Klebsiella oxytoca]
MKSKSQRRDMIYQYLRRHGKASVNFLANYTHVTPETIRSDLTSLEKEELIVRYHGGAKLVLKTTKNKIEITQRDHLNDLFRVLDVSGEKIMLSKSESDKLGKVFILGSFNVDIVARVNRFPKSGETLVAIENTIGPGGKGCNQAMAALYANAYVHFVAKVGTDHFSQFARNHFKSSGMDSYTLLQTSDYATGSAVIYVSDLDGENMIAISPGANKNISQDEVTALLPELESSDVLLVQLENNVDAVGELIRMARSLGKLVILNPAPYNPEIKPWLHMVDILTPNETEAGQLADIDVSDITSAMQAAEIIHGMGVGKVIITLGSNGILLFENGTSTHIPAFPAVAVDTTGAGDSFNGALASMLSNGQSLTFAARYASAFASLAVEREGAANMPNHQATLQRLEKYS